MIADLAMIGAGLMLLLAGGEALVRGAVVTAERLGVSRLLIGLIVVGFGTSSPELIVSLRAAISGTPGIVLGNVVGSNIANVMLVIGLAAALAPLTGWNRDAVREAGVAVAVSLVLYGFLQLSLIGRMQGALMLLALATYLATSYWLERRDRQTTLHEREVEEFKALPVAAPWAAPLLVLGGIAVLVFGADLLVRGAVSVAREMGVSEAVIGLSLVAVGTSLPELATALVAAWRGQSDVVLGNVIGSCIFNILAILGLTAVIAPVAVDPRFGTFDGTVMVVVIALLALLLSFAARIGRLWGAALAVGYAAYLWALFANGGLA